MSLVAGSDQWRFWVVRLDAFIIGQMGQWRDGDVVDAVENSGRRSRGIQKKTAAERSFSLYCLSGWPRMLGLTEHGRRWKEIPLKPQLTYFVQECPTCGRLLQVRVEYLGLRVACQHCRGRFVARDPALGLLETSWDDPQAGILSRVDQLLQRTQSAGANFPHGSDVELTDSTSDFSTLSLPPEGELPEETQAAAGPGKAEPPTAAPPVS